MGPADLPSLDDEPTPEFLRSLAVPVGAGRVEGILLRGREPLSGGRANLRDESFGVLIDPGNTRTPPRISVQVADDGTFAMTDVAPGSYTLELQTQEGDSLIWPIMVGDTPAGSTRLVGLLGRRIVKGRVFYRDGRPGAGVRVTVAASPMRPKDAIMFASTTLTASDGTYEVRGLPSGPYHLTAYLRGDGESAGRRFAEVNGDPSGTTVVDFGSDKTEPLWTGALLASDGSPIAGPTRIWLGIDGARMYIGIEVEVDAAGRFSKRVPAGEYPISLIIPGRPPANFIDIRTRLQIHGDLVRDVVLPGARVSGNVRDGATKEPLPNEIEQVHLAPEGGDRDSVIRLEVVKDGAFASAGIPPGRYAVTGWPVALVDSSGRPVTLEISETRASVQMDLWTVR